MRENRTPKQRAERGSVMVIAALAMVALVLFAALAIDVGFIWASRTQSQNAGDAAALAAASTMINQVGTGAATVTLGNAITVGTTYAASNSTVANDSVTVVPGDFTFGNWDLNTRTLDTSVDLTNPDLVTGVRVNVDMDGSKNARSPGLLSRLLQREDDSRPYLDGFDVANTAVAYKGFVGSWEPGDFNLPVAIDSCELSNNGGCGNDFCTHIPSGACALERPQTNTAGMICGEFSNTADQNMCYTAFDGEHPAINVPGLKGIVDDGNPVGVDAGDAVYLDNGDKTAVTDYIRDKFYGCGKFNTPAGASLYGGGFPDSWVVKLPVVECQDTAHCAGGSPFKITGGVCFEIREIIAPAPGKGCSAPLTGTSRLIKGRALCPNSTDAQVRALFDQYCRDDDEEENPTAPGGCNFGLRANQLVLVE